GDYVVTATYLINRFPLVVLGNKTPYEMLMNKKPSYSNLKVFGCLVVESNPSRVTDKMAPRGVPCLFLGYPPHQKGYTLLNLLTHARFVSKDVTFYEHIFPYSKSSMSHIRCAVVVGLLHEKFYNSLGSAPNRCSVVWARLEVVYRSLEE
ncbi:retrovirus-related pol polyprotein from transposon TNT 1-94, partial [Tanacetum coccineum]